MTRATVLDASALLAVLGDEPGASEVEAILDGAQMSTVNWSEVLGRFASLGLGTEARQVQIESLGISLLPFTSRQAELAAGLVPLTRQAGLSFADRACLAVALDIGAEPVTADRAWDRVDVGLAVRQIR